MSPIQQKKEEVIAKYGEWTAYDILLPDGVYTRSERAAFPQLKKTMELIQDVAQCEFSKLRILDLACLEGQYAIEFALHGAEVVGIEGREANIEKAIFAKNMLGLTNVDFYQDDVRNLCKDKYGEFDVVFCSGILYHLDAVDTFPFIEKMQEVCKKIIIIDTHIARQLDVSVTYKNQIYFGQTYFEHNENTSAEDKLKLAWASLDNVKSFWFSKPSLFNFLKTAGFSSIQESKSYNGSAFDADDRVTIVAFKKKDLVLKSSPMTNEYVEPKYSEQTLEEELSIYRELVNNLTPVFVSSWQKLDKLRDK